MRSVGNSNSAGMTPTTVMARAPRSVVRNSSGLPMIPLSDWKRRRQVSNDSTTTFGLDSSPSTSVRPSMACAPSIGSVVASVIPPHRRAVPCPVFTIATDVATPTTPESVVVRSRH